MKERRRRRENANILKRLPEYSREYSSHTSWVVLGTDLGLFDYEIDIPVLF